MSRPFQELIDEMSPESQEIIKRKTDELRTEMNLAELRHALSLTQERVARKLKVKQAAISKIENQSDLLIGTLRKVLRAMGADLKLVAKFPDNEVVIDQFTKLRKHTAARHKSCS